MELAPNYNAFGFQYAGGGFRSNVMLGWRPAVGNPPGQDFPRIWMGGYRVVPGVPEAYLLLTKGELMPKADTPFGSFWVSGGLVSGTQLRSMLIAGGYRVSTAAQDFPDNRGG